MNTIKQLFGRRFKVDSRHPICIFRQKALRAQGFSLASDALETNASIAGLTALLVATLAVLLILIGGGSIPRIERFTPEDLLRKLSISSNQKSTRDLLLARMNEDQERKFASQVHFVTELIMTHRSKAIIISPSQARSFSETIVAESMRSGFDPIFVASIIKSESTFNPFARSRAGAVGLMQMLPSTGAFIATRLDAGDTRYDVSHPEHNIKLGIMYLAYLRKIFHGDKEKMLVAYNWGPENVRQAIRANRPALTSAVNYARHVISRYRDWSQLFNSQASRYKHFDFERAAIDLPKSVG